MSHRFYLSSLPSEGDVLSLFDREAHHAVDVLRIRPRDSIRVLDGQGHIVDCEVLETRRGQVTAKILARKSVPRQPSEISLLQAIPKGKAFELIVEKATELGTARIIPLITDRVVVRLDEEESVRKLAKWRWIAVDSMKQCGNAWLPTIEPPMTLERSLDFARSCDLALVASLASNDHPGLHLTHFQAQHGVKPTSVAILVGPEGDFTPLEMERMAGSGVLPMTLGPLVLRAETAAIYCLSVLGYELQSGRTKAAES